MNRFSGAINRILLFAVAWTALMVPGASYAAPLDWTVFPNYGNIDVGLYSYPSLTDIDNDGDLDLLIGDHNGSIHLFENTGDQFLASWKYITSQYYSINVESSAKPFFVDINGDGKTDLFIGNGSGSLYYYENSGSQADPVWEQVATSYQGIDVGDNAQPTFADIDSDGDFDMFIGEYDGYVSSYPNYGNPQTPLWQGSRGLPTNATSYSTSYNRIHESQAWYSSSPYFADMDNDGDLDMLVGQSSAGLTAWRNDESSETPTWTLYNDFITRLGTDGASVGASLGDSLSICIGDIDSDGDYDILCGRYDGTIRLCQNHSSPPDTPPTSLLKVNNYSLNQHVLNLLPVFTWSGSFSDPDGKAYKGYQLQVGSDTDWESAELWDPGRTLDAAFTVAYNGSALSRGGRYYWRIRFVDYEDVWSNWSVTQNFRINTPPPDPVAGISPGMHVVTNNPVIGFSKGGSDTEGDTIWTCVYIGDTPVPSLAEVSSPDTEATLGNTHVLTDGESYFFRLRNWDGYEYSETYSLTLNFRINTPPPKPLIVSAPAVRETDHTPGLVWSMPILQSMEPEGDTFSYYVYLEKNPYPSGVDYAGTDTECVFDNYIFSDGETFYWRMRSYDGYEYSDYAAQEYGDVMYFNTPPPPPVLLSDPGMNIVDTGLWVNWATPYAEPDGDAVVYKLFVDTAPFPVKYILSTGDTAAPIFTDTLPLSRGTAYYLRICAADGTESSSYAPSAAGMPLRINTRPSIPSSLLPSAGSEIGYMDYLSWHSADSESDTITYFIQISTYPDFTGLLVSGNSINETRTLIYDLPVSLYAKDGVTYYWRVKATDGHEYSSYSETRNFVFESDNHIPQYPTSGYLPDGEDVPIVNPVLSWNAASDPDPLDTVGTLKYIVEISLDSGFSDPYIMRSIPGVASVQSPPLADNTKWYWRVTTVDDSGLASSPGVFKWFVVNLSNDNPAAPYNFAIQGISDTRSYSAAPLFKWSYGGDSDVQDTVSAVKFFIDISTNAAFQHVYKSIESETGSLSAYSPALKDNTVYYARIRARDSHSGYSSWSGGYYFVVDTAEESPSSPRPFYPVSGEELSQESALKWNASFDSDVYSSVTYRVEIAQDSNFNSIITVSAGVAEPQALLKNFPQYINLSDNTYYYWRVKALDNTNIYSSVYFSGERFFFNKENSPPSPPAGGLYPSEGIETGTALPLLRWNHAADPDLSDTFSTLRYQINVSDTELFITPIVMDVQKGRNYRNLDISLVEDRRYFWKVRTLDDSGSYSEWSAVSSFYINMKNDTPSKPYDIAVLDTRNGVLRDTYPAISWTYGGDPDPYDNAGNSRYYIQTDDNSNWSDANEFELTTDSGVYSVRIGPLADNRDYYLRIRSLDRNGAYSPWSDTVEFRLDVVNRPPTVPEPYSPVSGQEATPASLLAWSVSVDPNRYDTVKYSVEMSLTANFSSLVLSQPNIAGDSIRIEDLLLYNNLVDNNVYYWRVKAIDNNLLESDYSSAVMTFIFNRFNIPPEPPVSGFIPPPGGELRVSAPSFAWGAGHDTDFEDRPATLRYMVQFSTHADFIVSKSSLTGQGETSASLSAGALEDNFSWYWRVASIDNSGATSDWSASLYFYMNYINDAPLKAGAMYPSQYTELKSGGVLSWDAAADPDRYDTVYYRLDLSTSPGFTSVMFYETTVQNTFIALNNLSGYSLLSDNETYYWRLTPRDNSARTGPPSVSASPFFFNKTNSSPSPPPGITAPGFGETISTLFVSFSWEQGSDPDLSDNAQALSYIVEISSSLDFSGKKEFTAQNAYLNMREQLKDHTRYYWRIMTRDDEGATSAYSALGVFYINFANEPPSVPELSLPADGARVSGNSYLIWDESYDPDPGDTVRYRLEVSEKENFSTFSGIAENIAAHSLKISSFENLTDNKKYYWRVLSFDKTFEFMEYSKNRYFYYNNRNDLPVITDVVLRSSTAVPTVRSFYTVSVNGETVDADGDTVLFEYYWNVNGDTLYVYKNQAELAGGVFLFGDRIYVTVYPYDGITYGHPVRSGTVTVNDDTPLRVLSPLIANNVFVDIPETIPLVFSREVKPESVNSQTVKIRDEVLEANVPVQFALAADGKSVQITPDSPFGALKKYRLTVASSIRDIVDNTLGNTVELSFRTISDTVLVSFTGPTNKAGNIKFDNLESLGRNYFMSVEVIHYNNDVSYANARILEKQGYKIIPNSVMYPAFSLKTYEDDGDTVLTVPGGMTITVPYFDNNSDGFIDGTYLREDYISLYALNDATGGWEELRNVERNSAANNIKAVVNKPTEIYSIIYYNNNNDMKTFLSNYPNPFVIGEQAATALSYNILELSDNIMPLDVKIDIYTITGEFVRNFSFIFPQDGSKFGENSVLWDGLNGDGALVESGVYYSILSIRYTNEYTEKRTSKIAVVR